MALWASEQNVGWGTGWMDGPITLQRERACVRGKESKASCHGEESEYKTVPRPGCQGEHTADYFQHDTEVRQSSLVYLL